jgi:hypothetical protein
LNGYLCFIQTGDVFESFDGTSASEGTINYHTSPNNSTFSPSASLSNYHMPLPNSLILSVSEHEALRHYQTTFSLYRTTKDPNWSTHKVLLSLGSQNTMIMHLLLAVSINDSSLCRRDELSSPIAQGHFQAGALMLVEIMGRDSERNHVSLMAAYFFLYLYMSKKKICSSSATPTIELDSAGICPEI